MLGLNAISKCWRTKLNIYFLGLKEKENEREEFHVDKHKTMHLRKNFP